MLLLLPSNRKFLQCPDIVNQAVKEVLAFDTFTLYRPLQSLRPILDLCFNLLAATYEMNTTLSDLFKTGQITPHCLTVLLNLDKVPITFLYAIVHLVEDYFTLLDLLLD